MKFNLKNRPKIPSFYSGSEKEIRDEQWTHLVACYEWFEGFEKEIRQTLEWTEKKWHPRSPPFKGMREECIHRMKEILGEEPKVKEETKR